MGSSTGIDIDWNALLKKLTAVALNIFRKEGLFAADDSVMKGLGKSPSDFVHDAIMEFYANREKYTASSEGELFAVVVTILQNDFKDAYRRHAYQKSKDLSDEELNERELMPADNDGFATFESKVLAEQFYKYVDGDQELKEVIDAAAILAVEMNGPVKRDDIASLLGITPVELTKLNHRLQYRFHKHNGHS